MVGFTDELKDIGVDIDTSKSLEQIDIIDQINEILRENDHGRENVAGKKTKKKKKKQKVPHALDSPADAQPEANGEATPAKIVNERVVLPPLKRDPQSRKDPDFYSQNQPYIQHLHH